MRNGDFTGFGRLTSPGNDGNGVPCVGGTNMDQINPNCINNNVSLLFQQDFPLPNAPGFFNFIKGAAQGQNWREELIRVDQNVSDKLKVFVRYIHDAWTETDPVVQWSGDAFPTVHSEFNIPSRNLIIKLSTIINPTLLNEISYNYASNYPSRATPAMTILGATQKPAGYNVPQVFNENVYNFVPGHVLHRRMGRHQHAVGPVVGSPQYQPACRRPHETGWRPQPEHGRDHPVLDYPGSVTDLALQSGELLL
jgi:hypothetical protein